MRKDEAVGRLCSVSDSCQSASTECRCDTRTAGNRPHAATIPTYDSAVRESFTEPSTRAAMHNRGRCSFGIDDSGFSSAVSFGVLSFIVAYDSPRPSPRAAIYRLRPSVG